MNSVYNTKYWTEKFISAGPSDRYDEERVDMIMDIIPADVRSVLDAGVGGGYIFRRLKERKGLISFGFDISLEMLKKSKDGRVCACDIKKIPFKDRAFDLVVAADIIEHIDMDAFDESISELARVAKDYILINSPYKDAVNWPVSLCDKCKREFNIYGHMRSVDMKLIRESFRGKAFKVLRSGVIGRKRDPRPAPLVYIARKLGKAYSKEGAICPYCFNPSITAPERNAFEMFFSKVVSSIFFVMDRLIPPFLKSGSEMYVLLCRKKRT